jgi:hypothetical protein
MSPEIGLGSGWRQKSRRHRRLQLLGSALSFHIHALANLAVPRELLIAKSLRQNMRMKMDFHFLYKFLKLL